jgi:hypothetical protein
MVNNLDRPAVQWHMSTMQSIIQRMASNSSSCKSYCVTLVSAILVLIIDKNKHELLPIVFLPIVLFLVLDIYYLNLERRFRKSYDNFVQELHQKILPETEILKIKPSRCTWSILAHSVLSTSILIFYIPLLLMFYLISNLYC